MTRIWDLDSIQDGETPPSTSVTILSDGTLTKKISIENLRRVMVEQATDTNLGVIRVGDGLLIDEFGTLSVESRGDYVLPHASVSTLGGVKVGQNLKISSTGVLDTKYNLDLATRNLAGVVRIGDNISVDDAGIISVAFPDYTTYQDTGLKIGATQDLKILIENGNTPLINSVTEGKLVLRVNNPGQGNGTTSITLLNSNQTQLLGGDQTSTLMPDATNLVNIGTTHSPWNNIYANQFIGNLSGISTKANSLYSGGSYYTATSSATNNTIATRDSSGKLTAVGFVGNLTGVADMADTVKVGTNYRTATVDTDTTVTSNTIVVRDTDGSIHAPRFSGVSEKANLLAYNGAFYMATPVNSPNTIVMRDATQTVNATTFNGTAVQAKFADLAEKYISDKQYDVGTVVIFGGEFEITTTNVKGDYRVAGVISGEPAYLMNNESSGLPVALRGKVPVKIIGPVQKGDLIISSAVPGYAMSCGYDLNNEHTHAVFAKSLENKSDYDSGVIMAVII